MSLTYPRNDEFSGSVSHKPLNNISGAKKGEIKARAPKNRSTV